MPLSLPDDAEFDANDKVSVVVVVWFVGDRAFSDGDDDEDDDEDDEADEADEPGTRLVLLLLLLREAAAITAAASNSNAVLRIKRAMSSAPVSGDW